MSIHDFMTYINDKMADNPQQYISAWAGTTRGLNNLLNTSKGRDKFCQLI
jgi:hypothetical protein